MTPSDWELAPPLNNLPTPLSSFVGRHADLAKIEQLSRPIGSSPSDTGKLGASGRAEVAVWFATDHALHGGEST
ncbi:hypothetical protein [Nocardia tengchongensis]|uniref:hypothetical protein n=1 Tax=Nocardia tengchongensis TaxID=2055889 RepID=UPI0036AC5B1B